MGQRGTGSADRVSAESQGLREIPSRPTWKVLRSNEAFSASLWQLGASLSTKPPGQCVPDMPSPWGQRQGTHSGLVTFNSRKQANMQDSLPHTTLPCCFIMKSFTHTSKAERCNLEHLYTYHLDFTITIFLYLSDHKWSISKSILFLWCIQSEIQISVHFLPNISACVSLTRAQNLYFSYVKFTYSEKHKSLKKLYIDI